MKRVQIDCKLSRLYTKAKFVLVLIVMAALCASTLAQENTAEGWIKRARHHTRTNPLQTPSKPLKKPPR